MYLIKSCGSNLPFGVWQMIYTAKIIMKYFIFFIFYFYFFFFCFLSQIHGHKLLDWSTVQQREVRLDLGGRKNSYI